MPFAFGQKINLVQGNRSGINPIKWGFLGDISGGQNGNSVLSSEINNILTSGAMAISSSLVCGTPETCIGNFGTSADAGFTSGNNINNNLAPYGEGNLNSPEKWRNIEIPPGANGITFYIETRPAPPANVLESEGICKDVYGLCSTGTCSLPCNWSPGSGSPLACDNVCSANPFCCGATAGSGAEAGCYAIHVDLSNFTQQTLYLYTSWFNGLQPGGYIYDDIQQGPPIANCDGIPVRADLDALNCSDNMRFLLFPRLPANDPNYDVWPYSDMNTPILDIRVYRAGRVKSTPGRAMPFAYCRPGGEVAVCDGAGNAEKCELCDIGICDGCISFNGNDASESFVTSTIFTDGNGVAYPITINPIALGGGFSHEDLWGSYDNDGVTDTNNTGIWNTVFGWNTTLEDSFVSINYGGPELPGAVINCEDYYSTGGGTTGTPQSNAIDLGRGCTGTWKSQLPAGSTYANGITGAQIVGFHIG
jgi:hypothetical protein